MAALIFVGFVGLPLIFVGFSMVFVAFVGFVGFTTYLPDAKIFDQANGNQADPSIALHLRTPMEISWTWKARRKTNKSNKTNKNQ